MIVKEIEIQLYSLRQRESRPPVNLILTEDKIFRSTSAQKLGLQQRTN